MRYFILAFVLMFATTSCKTLSQRSNSKHEFGETRRTPDHKHEPCSYDGEPEFAKIDIYLQKLSNHIMDKNPKTFKDIYAKDKFCVHLNPFDFINAFAEPKERSMVVTRGLFEYSESDAEIAGSICHELAHITMSHTNAVHPKIKENKQYQQAFEAHEKAIEILKKEKKAAYAEYDRLDELLFDLRRAPNKDTPETKKKIEETSKALDAATNLLIDIAARRETEVVKLDEVKDSIVARDEQANWYEQEADEVGFEFYLRAGFNPTLYQWTRPGAVPNFDIAKCRAQIKLAATDPTHTPIRGEEDHPDYCWRIYDIEVLEGKRHRDEYSKLKEGATTVNLYPNELEKLKTTIQE